MGMASYHSNNNCNDTRAAQLARPKNDSYLTIVTLAGGREEKPRSEIQRTKHESHTCRGNQLKVTCLLNGSKPEGLFLKRKQLFFFEFLSDEKKKFSKVDKPGISKLLFHCFGFGLFPLTTKQQGLTAGHKSTFVWNEVKSMII